MLAERRFSKSSNIYGASASARTSKNSAGATALSCSSEAKLRCPCYCEENVWRLAYRRLNGAAGANTDKENDEYHVVFISNPEK